MGKTASDEFVDKYKELVYGVAYTNVKRKSEADDVFQEVFLTYFSKERKFEDEEHIKAWLIRTTINMCRRENLSLWNLRNVFTDEIGENEKIKLRTKEEEQLLEAVMSLSSKYRLPVWLHYFEGMPTEEVARTLGLKNDAVRKRLSRARAQLKEQLKEDLL